MPLLPLALVPFLIWQPPAPATQHWALLPVRNVAVPYRSGASDANPIDSFIAARQRELRVSPAQPADRRTLIRRASYDLTGLPPTPEQIDSFLSDTSPDAFARLVDRLLASPAYGEKWGRMWLDVARYADTAGETADFPVPEAWRYRNWVIGAFNADRPYDQFLREQLAGDLMAARLPQGAALEQYRELVTATTSKRTSF
jgi:hypothetical protein